MSSREKRRHGERRPKVPEETQERANDRVGGNAALVVVLDPARTLKVRWRHRAEVWWVPVQDAPAEVRPWGNVPGGSELREGTECRINLLVDLFGGLPFDRYELGLTAVHHRDLYSRRTGRRVSLIRAMEAMQGVTGLTKADRAQVWAAMLAKGW